MIDPVKQISISRRALLCGGALVLFTGPLGCSRQRLQSPDSKNKKDDDPMLTIGLLTDVHFAEKETAGTRHYRQGLARVQNAVAAFNQADADFAVELGDFVDRADLELELGFLKKIERTYAQFAGPRYYVLGNHCVDTLTKDEFIQNTAMTAPHYSFDHGKYHFVVLDACYRADGVAYGRHNFDWKDSAIPLAELDWLANDLAQSNRPTIVFAHQRLDLEGPHGIKNQAQVRKVLEQSENVRAVFQGHNHLNDLQEINEIFYLTLAAVVEGGAESDNAFAILRINANGEMRIDGFANQQDWLFKA